MQPLLLLLPSQVVGALLDSEADDTFINNLILSVRSLIPVEALVDEVEKRNKLKLLNPFLEQLVSEGSKVGTGGQKGEQEQSWGVWEGLFAPAGMLPRVCMPAPAGSHGCTDRPAVAASLFPPPLPPPLPGWQAATVAPFAPPRPSLPLSPPSLHLLP